MAPKTISKLWVHTVVLLIGCSLALTGPALAASAGAGGFGPLNRLMGPVVSGAEGPWVFDQTCPLNDDPSVYSGPGPHERWQALVGGNGPAKSLTIDGCVEVSGALGGESFQSGTFSLVTKEGTVNGTIAGSEGFSRVDYFNITLTITAGTRGLAHTSGTLSFFGCLGGAGNTITAANVASAFSGSLPSACGLGF